jgi:S-adenosylmethionine:tRNA ribosyltransferase-isomerase
MARVRTASEACAHARRLSLQLSDFDYALPPELIAQHPALERAASRLLHLDGKSGAMEDLAFRDIVRLLAPGDLLVVNDTRVIKARLRGRKDSGGEVGSARRARDRSERALAQVRASKTPKAGRRLLFARDVEAEVLGRHGEFFELRFNSPVLDVLSRHGETPLPPYITHVPQADDDSRYQTVYARNPGAVARPPRGCISTSAAGQLRRKGVGVASVTLHVGAGTFQPVRTEDVSQHVMHAEWYDIPDDRRRHRGGAANGGARVAVGTTALRALESAARRRLARAAPRDAAFHRPGIRFRVVDRLVTNFHLPRSTLLMLVSHSRGRRTSAAPTRTPSRSATASSATATRCCSSGRLRGSGRPGPSPARDRCPNRNRGRGRRQRVRYESRRRGAPG